MIEYGLHSLLRMHVESIHLRLGISLGKDGHVYGLSRIAAAVEIAVRQRSLAMTGHKFVVGAVHVGHRRHRPVAGVEQFYGDERRVGGEGHKENVRHGPLRGQRFGSGEPFVKQRGECRDIEGVARSRILHGHRTVAGKGSLVEPGAPSGPSGRF